MAKTVRQPTFIRAWREARGLSLEALGAEVGMAKGNLSKIERGINQYGQDVIERIAKVLDCSVADLLARDPARSRELWQILADADDAQRQRVAAVAEAMLRFDASPPASASPADRLDTLVGEIRSRRTPARGKAAKASNSSMGKRNAKSD